MIRPVTCPICERQIPAQDGMPATFPFCSDRCRKVDLFRWFDGKYAIVEPANPESLESLLEPGMMDSDGESHHPDE